MEDTYAEAFRSIYAEVLITARDRKLARSCRGGRDRQCFEHDPVRLRSGAGSLRRPRHRDVCHARRPSGAVVQFHVPRFRKDRLEALERSLLVRISQNVLTCPTTALLQPARHRAVLQAGSQAGLLRRRLPDRGPAFGRRVWVVPILGGEFVIDRRFGFRDGLMGGNLWFMGSDEDCRAR